MDAVAVALQQCLHCFADDEVPKLSLGNGQPLIVDSFVSSHRSDFEICPRRDEDLISAVRNLGKGQRV